MYSPLYLRDTAHWYALMGYAQAETGHYIEQEVENYLVYLLETMSGDVVGAGPHKQVLAELNATFQPVREKHLVKVQEVAEQCIMIAGLFPEHARRTGISLLYFMETGQSAYRDLHTAVPQSPVYSYIAKHYVNVIDVLQKLAELCGSCYPLDLIQACELWQETGSHHGLEFIINQTHALPITQGSELRH